MRRFHGCAAVSTFFLVLALAASAAAQSAHLDAIAPGAAPARSPRNASYTIDVRLNAPGHSLVGSEVITWRNLTRQSTAELQFHLYWNAWANTRSTWMRENPRGRQRPPADFSRLEVTSVRLLKGDATDLTATGHFIAPDDGNAEDRTVMTVSLPQAVQPGETIQVEVRWTARVPRTFDRTGVIGNFFFIAQWFPKLGVLQDSGWNCHQFHAETEFFSDYGVYDVSMTVPTGWVVGATGTEHNRRNNSDGTTTHQYVQEDVHDFAWTTSPDYLVHAERFDEPGLPPVDMRLLMQPEHERQSGRHFAAARSALRRYGQWFGAYPYGHITIVDPAYQSGAGGMEYPTLITAGTRWLTARTDGDLEDTVVHEAGHQFWYGIVGTNEFEHAWMDEGLNTFSAARVLSTEFAPFHSQRRYFGGFVPWAFRDVIRSRDDWDRLAGYRQEPTVDVLATPTYKTPARAVSFITYDKTSVWLDTLEQWLGWPALQTAMSRFFARGAFGHPGPEVFLSELQQAAGRDLTGFLDQTYRGSAVFDYGVESLGNTREGGRFMTRVVVRRYGDGIFPVDLAVTFEDGEQATDHWNGADRWHEFTYSRAARARSAVVDPGHTLLLDTNFTNNSRTSQPRAAEAATKWSLHWMIWLQDALLSWGLFV
jgi:hypothetical protein